MKVTDELIEKIAALAKLEFDKDSKEEIKKDLGRILAFVDKLNEVNTDNVEPLAYLTEEEPVLREDVSMQTISREEALKNAPGHDSEYFKTPKVIKSVKPGHT
jgi:aspartyl-tRNA(Asn)/glutamyl-tRNA(Gln) amidotransferase subunit C